MRDIFFDLAIVVVVASSIAVLMFSLVAWLFPMDGYPEGDYRKLLRNSFALFVTIVASTYLQRRIWRALGRK